MKKIIYIILLTTIGTNFVQAQVDPGFGEEGGGDAQTAPTAPIDNLLLPLLITGIITTIYFVRKKERQLKQN